MSFYRNVLAFGWLWSWKCSGEDMRQSAICNICKWLLRSFSSPFRDHYHWSNTRMVLIKLCQLTVVPCPLCRLWAAGWWEWVHSLFSQDREAGRGCLCTPRRPSWLCPGSVCWGCVPSVCSLLTESQTVERGPWRALGPDPFPEENKQTRTKQWFHVNSLIFREPQLHTAEKSCRYVPSARNWPFSLPSHLCLPFWRSQSAERNETRDAHSQNLCVQKKQKFFASSSSYKTNLCECQESENVSWTLWDKSKSSWYVAQWLSHKIQGTLKHLGGLRKSDFKGNVARMIKLILIILHLEKQLCGHPVQY